MALSQGDIDEAVLFAKVKRHFSLSPESPSICDICMRGNTKLTISSGKTFF